MFSTWRGHNSARISAEDLLSVPTAARHSQRLSLLTADTRRPRERSGLYCPPCLQHRHPASAAARIAIPRAEAHYCCYGHECNKPAKRFGIEPPVVIRACCEVFVAVHTISHHTSFLRRHPLDSKSARIVSRACIFRGGRRNAWSESMPIWVPEPASRSH